LAIDYKFMNKWIAVEAEDGSRLIIAVMHSQRCKRCGYEMTRSRLMIAIDGAVNNRPVGKPQEKV
jgi:hypothetical protein